MSTRSIITFKSEDGILQAYKHWDGYPETTVPELQEFLKWNGHRNDDLTYTVANYCYWFKTKIGRLFSGLGILPKKVMNYKQASEEYNAEYFYIVDLVENRIYEEVSSQYWDFTHKTPKKYMGYVLEYRSIDWKPRMSSVTP